MPPLAAETSIVLSTRASVTYPKKLTYAESPDIPNALRRAENPESTPGGGTGTSLVHHRSSAGMAAYSPAGESPVTISPGLKRALPDLSTAEKTVTTTGSPSNPGVQYVLVPESNLAWLLRYGPSHRWLF
ncbi:hypothetical protein SUNI508_02569 [Seiridium unicorne]|uniref:Uncharacterized protein n=1 Tax=Seiridium unicorne TaxID=138068 RepID=A0ABR2UFX7_9PEZI